MSPDEAWILSKELIRQCNVTPRSGIGNPRVMPPKGGRMVWSVAAGRWAVDDRLRQVDAA